MSNIRRAARRDANEARIVEALRGVGFLVELVNKADWPDLIIIHPRCGTCFIEVKSKRGRVSDGQRAVIENINAHGGNAFIARSTTEVLEHLGWA